MISNSLDDSIVLRVSGLSKVYKNQLAVDDLHLEVKRGEIFGLLGHNGAGKSTTIECILGTRKMDKGNVRLFGMDPIKDRKKLFQKVGVQLQESSYQNKIKVKELCQMTQILYSNPLDYRQLLKDFRLEEKSSSFVEELSGGQKQKLSVLLSLLPNPQIIFLDELTTGLDPKARREIWNYLEKLKESGVTIFLTSHYMDEVEYLCDRICILKQGKAVISDTPKSVIERSGRMSLEDAYLYYTGEEELEYEAI